MGRHAKPYNHRLAEVRAACNELQLIFAEAKMAPVFPSLANERYGEDGLLNRSTVVARVKLAVNRCAHAPAFSDSTIRLKLLTTLAKDGRSEKEHAFASFKAEDVLGPDDHRAAPYDNAPRLASFRSSSKTEKEAQLEYSQATNLFYSKERSDARDQRRKHNEACVAACRTKYAQTPAAAKHLRANFAAWHGWVTLMKRIRARQKHEAETARVDKEQKEQAKLQGYLPIRKRSHAEQLQYRWDLNRQKVDPSDLQEFDARNDARREVWGVQSHKQLQEQQERERLQQHLDAEARKPRCREPQDFWCFTNCKCTGFGDQIYVSVNERIELRAFPFWTMERLVTELQNKHGCGAAAGMQLGLRRATSGFHDAYGPQIDASCELHSMSSKRSDGSWTGLNFRTSVLPESSEQLQARLADDASRKAEAASKKADDQALAQQIQDAMKRRFGNST